MLEYKKRFMYIEYYIKCNKIYYIVRINLYFMNFILGRSVRFVRYDVYIMNYL